MAEYPSWLQTFVTPSPISSVVVTEEEESLEQAAMRPNERSDVNPKQFLDIIFHPFLRGEAAGSFFKDTMQSGIIHVKKGALEKKSR
jgi:hypothetical protein